jgi:hypothetical protein
MQHSNKCDVFTNDQLWIRIMMRDKLDSAGKLYFGRNESKGIKKHNNNDSNQGSAGLLSIDNS